MSDNQGFGRLGKKEYELSIEGGNRVESVMQETHSAKPAAFAKTIKPRALVFKAANKDFEKITELIKSEFPEVEILYITTGPVKSILRVTKSLPFEMQDYSEQSFYTIE